MAMGSVELITILNIVHLSFSHSCYDEGVMIYFCYDEGVVIYCCLWCYIICVVVLHLGLYNMPFPKTSYLYVQSHSVDLCTENRFEENTGI